MHLDEPFAVRYLDWLRSAAHGDFGRSFSSYMPVLALYQQRIGNTAVLAACATALAAAIGIPLGTLAAYQRGGAVDGAARSLAALGAAVPGFWLAYTLIFLFAVTLRWLPASSATPSFRGIILPVVVLATGEVSVLTRLTRSVVLDVLRQEFVTVAWAKGLTGITVARRHLLPNALTPVLTVLGLEAAYLMTGAAVVEYVFNWPGIGKLAIDAALLRDTPVVIGFAVAAALIFVIINLAVNVAAALIDPRVRSV